jgi:hypothetical protein
MAARSKARKDIEMPNSQSMRKPPLICKFSPGQIILDRSAKRRLTSDEVIAALDRHIYGDWGKVRPQQKEANEKALLKEGSLQSVYYTSDGVRFSIVTNKERTVTTVKVI